MFKKLPVILIVTLTSVFAVAESTEDLTITLKDGRTLGYAIYGSETGAPVMYFYGSGGSRYMGRRLDSLAQAEGIQLIVPDRPGIGHSTFVKKRKLTDWPADVDELATALGIGNYSVMSESGGTPYAAVCAWALPEKVDQAIIVSGVSPTTGEFDLSKLSKPLQRNMKLSRRAPLWFLRFNYKQIDKLITNDPERFIELISDQFAAPDKEIMASKSEQLIMINSFKEAFRQGYAGVALETRLYARDWGFALDEIQVPVLIYHGDLDQNAPVAMAEFMGAKISGAILTVMPGEGHATIMLNHGRQVFSVVPGFDADSF